MFIAGATKKTFDPGWGRTGAPRHICFYKHAIPPGLKARSGTKLPQFF